MSFTACCWKSWRIKENHVECIYIQVSWVPPLHLQANILPFNHAYWLQSHIACVWIFTLLVSPSSRKTEKKKHFPWLENKNYHVSGFAGVCGYLRAFAGYLWAFCGTFLSQKTSFSGFCGICELLRFQNPFRMPQSSSVLCEANLDLPNASSFSKY